MQKEERWKKIQESRFNRWYKIVKGEGIPGYLKKKWGGSRWRRVARYRLGNEMREARYCEEEEEKRCRLCGRGEHIWEYIWGECRRWKKGNEET